MYLKTIKYLRQNIEDFSQYPFNIECLSNFKELELPSNVTFFVGENGSGKSTLLEAIADICGFNTAGGGKQNTYEVHEAESALGIIFDCHGFAKYRKDFFCVLKRFISLPVILIF